MILGVFERIAEARITSFLRQEIFPIFVGGRSFFSVLLLYVLSFVRALNEFFHRNEERKQRIKQGKSSSSDKSRRDA